MTNQIDEEIKRLEDTMSGIKSILDHVETRKERWKRILHSIFPARHKYIYDINMNMLGLGYGIVSLHKEVLELYKKIGTGFTTQKNEEKDPMYG